MRLIVLKQRSYPSAGACSGYLVIEGDTKILIDCGNGILSNLQKFIKHEDLNAVILSSFTQ